MAIAKEWKERFRCLSPKVLTQPEDNTSFPHMQVCHQQPTPHHDYDAVFLGRQLAAFYQMQNYYLEEEQSPPETCLQLEAKINICLSLFSIHQVEGS